MTSLYSDYPSMDQDNAHHASVVRRDSDDLGDQKDGIAQMATSPSSITDGGRMSLTDRYFSKRGAAARSTNVQSSGAVSGDHNHAQSLAGCYSPRYFYKNQWFWLCTAICVILFGAIGTGVAVSNSKEAASMYGQVGTELPRPDLDESATLQNKNTLGQFLLTKYTNNAMDWSIVNQPDSFQGRALTYVAGSSLFAQLTLEQNAERYAIAVFYLATYRQPHLLLSTAPAWTSDKNWLSKESVCVWEGILCNDNDAITSIMLPNHGLSGSLPTELALLESLAVVDLTTNFLYMEGQSHQLWMILTSLRELTMDDNFFVSETGLPAEFAGLKSIEKISLSYNLLQGQLEGALFTSIPTLQHLEIESNYISGALPDELLSMPNLVYLYARRNSFDLFLPTILQAGNLPSIFALWLDSNTVTGSIPASIGQLTDLASLSVTSAGLTGTLPTELGLLTAMRRCWLYENQLQGSLPTQIASWTSLQVLEIYGNNVTGQMPQPLCTAVAESDYEFRTLSADCDQVACANCCTECYGI
jgi:hypothetical protein